MSEDSNDTRFSLRRWSQRKLAATRSGQATDAPVVGHGSATRMSVDTLPDAEPKSAASPGGAGASVPGAPSEASAVPGEDARASRADTALPPVESLTFDSDFTAFMRPGVDGDVR